VIVCAAVLVLRAKRPEARRPFRVPLGPVFPVLGILSCSYLMLSLPIITWARFLIWLDIGMVIYWFYGRTHSPLVNRKESSARTPMQAFANFVTTAGLLLIFNFACITLLGYMTEFGITNETTAKWAEIGVTADQADTFGLKWLTVAIAVYLLGFGLTKASGEK
jgi:amino acid transporter